MNVVYNITLVIAILVALVFAFLVFVTGKGDAMSGGGSVRTSFKGKASFEDAMSRVTLYLGVAFMVLMLGLDVLSNIQDRDASRERARTNTAPPATPGEPPSTTTTGN